MIKRVESIYCCSVSAFRVGQRLQLMDPQSTGICVRNRTFRDSAK